MTPERWVSLGAGVLLLTAGVAQGLALFRVRLGPRRWELLTIGGRLGGATALTAALILAVLAHGQWSPSDLRQVTLGLALATLIVYLPLAWRSGVGGAGPVVDMVTLALILVNEIAVQPGGPAPSCAQRAVPFQAQWVLFLLGHGAVVAAGSAGLMRLFQALVAGRGGGLRLPHRIDLDAFLRQAILLALLVLGSGIAVSVWWAWRTVGTLSDGDPRVGWAAITWLVAATSELAWRLDRSSLDSGHEDKSGQWAAGLALIAAATTILGLLAVVDLRRLLGT